MEQLIELLIQRTYRYCKESYYSNIQEKLLFIKNKSDFLISLHNSFVYFEGWEFSYERYGKTLSRQSTYFVDEVEVYQHNIKLNRYFLLSLMGYQLSPDNLFAYRFTFDKLLETIAEEVAHCLVREFYYNVDEHGYEFQKIKNKSLTYLKKEKIVELFRQELEKNKII